LEAVAHPAQQSILRQKQKRLKENVLRLKNVGSVSKKPWQKLLRQPLVVLDAAP
jgi:hypothetical protein